MLKKIIPALMNNPRIYDLVQLVLEGDYSNIITDTLALSPEEKLLDIGCGNGYFSQFIKCQYTGIDIEPKYIKFAQKKYQTERKKFLFGTAQKINFPSESFDKTMLINVSHHLSDENLKQVLAEAKRLTKKEIFIFDMIADKNTIVTPLLLALDNGKFIRSMAEQLKLIGADLNIKQSFTFLTPRKLFTHSAIKCESAAPMPIIINNRAN